jgi:hypothetical protein
MQFIHILTLVFAAIALANPVPNAEPEMAVRIYLTPLKFSGDGLLMGRTGM